MKNRKWAVMGIIGLILVINPLGLIFYFPWVVKVSGDKINQYMNIIMIICNLIALFGNILLSLFFYSYFVRNQRESKFKSIGILGIISHGLTASLKIILIISYIISFFSNKDILGTARFYSIPDSLSSAVSLSSIIILVVNFSIYYIKLSREDSLKKYVLIALIGYCLSCFMTIFNKSFYEFFMHIIINSGKYENIKILGIANYIFWALPQILYLVYFIRLYNISDKSSLNLQVSESL